MYDISISFPLRSSTPVTSDRTSQRGRRQRGLQPLTQTEFEHRQEKANRLVTDELID